MRLDWFSSDVGMALSGFFKAQSAMHFPTGRIYRPQKSSDIWCYGQGINTRTGSIQPNQGLTKRNREYYSLLNSHGRYRIEAEKPRIMR